MTEAEYRVLDKQQDSLIKYIRRQKSVIAYVGYCTKEDCGYCVPRGVLVACNPVTLARLQAHAKRYYPNMSVMLMTSEQYFYHKARHLGVIVTSLKEE